MADDMLVKGMTASAAEAPVIAIAVVRELGPPPRAWSGVAAAYQEVAYRPLRWLWVTPPLAPDLDRHKVRHLVVARSRTADPQHPGLRADLFKEGAEFLLFIDLVDGQWTCVGENSDTMSAAPGW